VYLEVCKTRQKVHFVVNVYCPLVVVVVVPLPGHLLPHLLLLLRRLEVMVGFRHPLIRPLNLSFDDFDNYMQNRMLLDQTEKLHRPLATCSASELTFVAEFFFYMRASSLVARCLTPRAVQTCRIQTVVPRPPLLSIL
jgi:hypothetical protein